MRDYRVTAQSYTTSERIAKTVQAADEAAVLKLVSAELDSAGYYVIDIKAA